MIGNRGGRRVGTKLAFCHQRLQILGVVHHFEVAAQLTVFLAYSVHAVRAGGDDQLRFRLVEGRHILAGELLIQKLISGAPRAVASTAFFLAENSEIHSRMIEQLDKGTRRLLRLGIVAGSASNPVENIGLRILLDRLHPESLGPIHALLVIDAPWIVGPLHAAECGLQLSREVALDHHLVAANVDDVEHGLILHRADLHARAAGGAGPGGFGRQGEGEQRARACFRFEAG